MKAGAKGAVGSRGEGGGEAREEDMVCSGRRERERSASREKAKEEKKRELTKYISI